MKRQFFTCQSPYLAPTTPEKAPALEKVPEKAPNIKKVSEKSPTKKKVKKQVPKVITYLDYIESIVREELGTPEQSDASDEGEGDGTGSKNKKLIFQGSGSQLEGKLPFQSNFTSAGG